MRADKPTILEPFPTTEWSLVARAGKSGTGCGSALADLVRQYQEPLRSHLIIVRRLDPDQAADLIQGFLASQVLERGLVRRAERAKGRFRTFILMALNRYVANQLRDARAAKRDQGRAVSLHEHVDAACQQLGPPDMFDLVWVRQVLNQSLDRMRRDCAMLGRSDLWGVFEARVVRPAFEEVEPLPYGELIRTFGLGSPSQASNVLMTAKRMFQRYLRATISEYEPDPAAIDREIVELREILSRPMGKA